MKSSVLKSDGRAEMPASQDRVLPWLGPAKTVIAGGFALGAVLLHMAGSIRHRNYLYAWQIDPELFPRTTESTLIGGFYVLFFKLLEAFNAMLSVYAVLFICTLTAVIFVLRAFQGWLDRLEVPKSERHWLRKWQGQLLASAMLSTMAYFAAPIAIGIFIMVSAHPASLAEVAARESFQRDLQAFRKGCAGAKESKVRCIELKKEGVPIVRGFMITSSASHIALYDVESHRTRIIERGATELLSEEFADATTTPISK
jgi:hypothetical protein